MPIIKQYSGAPADSSFTVKALVDPNRFYRAEDELIRATLIELKDKLVKEVYDKDDFGKKLVEKVQKNLSQAMVEKAISESLAEKIIQTSGIKAMLKKLGGKQTKGGSGGKRSED